MTVKIIKGSYFNKLASPLTLYALKTNDKQLLGTILSITHDTSGLVALAVENNFILGLETLLSIGAPLNGYPLQRAVRHRYKEIIEMLLKKGINLDEYEFGNSLYDEPVLIQAIRNNDIEIAELLLSNGADINKRGVHEYPLGIAIDYGHNKMVQWLLNKGADPNKSLFGSPYIDVAVSNHHSEIVSELLDARCSLNFRSEKGWSLLHKAIKNGDVTIAKLLILHGADINARTNSGYTCYCFAKWYEVKAIEEMLHNAGAILGDCPLHPPH